jgi:hypothetical protein
MLSSRSDDRQTKVCRTSRFPPRGDVEGAMTSVSRRILKLAPYVSTSESVGTIQY